MKSIILSLILIVFQNALFAQKEVGDIKPSDFKRLEQLEDSIALLAKIAVQDTVLNNRVQANTALIPLIEAALNVPNSFNYAFTKVENIAIQKPLDGAFRVFTWQLFIDQAEYRYFGYVQLNRSKSVFFELTDDSRNLENAEKEVLTPEHWFGAIYYNVKEFKTKDGMKYLLFGYNANDQYEKIKVCDVLVLRGNKMSLGSPVFEIADIQGVRKQKLHRLVLNYSADAVLRLNYDPEMNIVIHDHLEQIGTKDPNLPFTYVPDGTYEAFELQKEGMWLHVDKLANTEMKTAPRPRPTLNSRNRMKSAKENAQKVVWPDEVKKNN